MLPDTEQEQRKQRKVANAGPVRLYGGKASAKNQESIFPDPHRFQETKPQDQRKKGKGQRG